MQGSSLKNDRSRGLSMRPTLRDDDGAELLNFVVAVAAAVVAEKRFDETALSNLNYFKFQIKSR